eukprot:6492202-Amphidinium_carterae.1
MERVGARTTPNKGLWQRVGKNLGLQRDIYHSGRVNTPTLIITSPISPILAWHAAGHATGCRG